MPLDQGHNQAAPVNAPIASWFQFVHLWRRVTEQQRSADGASLECIRAS
jgi:hypothetical protein